MNAGDFQMFWIVKHAKGAWKGRAGVQKWCPKLGNSPRRMPEYAVRRDLQLIPHALVTALLLLTVGTFAVGLAAIPSLLLALIWRADERRLSPDETPARITYWQRVLLCTLGGLGGEICAVAPFDAAMQAAARVFPEKHPGFTFNCAQCGLIFVFTVPIFLLLGSAIALAWTWLSVRIPDCRLHASIFTYRGPSRTANRIVAVAVQVIFWSLWMWGSFHLNVLLAL